MPKEDSLHLLIRSLSPAEKRYFRVSCEGSGKPNNYMLLFKAIDQMEVYEEGALMKKFEGKNFIKHLPSEKNYLHELILKTMRSFNDSRTVAHELHNYLQDIHFLFEKGMYEFCLKRIRKAKRLAYDFDKYGELLDLLFWQRKILKYVYTTDLILQSLELTEERNSVLAIQQNEYSYMSLYDDIFALVRESNGKAINDEKINTALVVLDSHPLLQTSMEAISFRAKTFYYLCKASVSLLKKDLELCRRYYKEGVMYWESRPDRINEEPDRYKAILFNYIIQSQQFANDEDVIVAIQKLKTMPKQTLKEEANDFQRVYFMELYYYMNEADLSNALRISIEMEQKLSVYEDLLDRSNIPTLYYNIAILYFVRNDYVNCQKWLEKIIALKVDVRKDIQHFVRVLEVIIHFETSEPNVADYYYGMTYRYLYKYARINEFEHTVISYMRKLIKIPDRGKLNLVLMKLNEELKAMLAKQDKSIGVEELSCWIEAKIARKTMEEILKIRVNNRKADQSKAA